MKVLAIDPGYDRMGVAIVEIQQQKETVLFSTCIQTDKNTPLADRIYTLGQALQVIITEHKPDTLAIETLFFNKNIKTAIAVAQARGAILLIAKQNNCVVYEFGPQEIKVAITGYGKSDKVAVTNMVKSIVANVPGNAIDDEYDAIAVGVTCLAHYGRNI